MSSKRGTYQVDTTVKYRQDETYLKYSIIWVPSVQAQEELIMQRVMTYNQWELRFKKALKRTIKQKAIQTLQIFIVTVLMFMPVLMFVDWLLRGY